MKRVNVNIKHLEETVIYKSVHVGGHRTLFFSSPTPPRKSSSIVKIETAKNNVIIIPLTLLVCTYCSGDKIEKSEVGGACSTCGGEERRVQGFGGEV